MTTLNLQPSSTYSFLVKDKNDGGVNNAAYTKASTLPDVKNDAARNAAYKAAEQALYG